MNEAIASAIMEKLGIKHVPYALLFDDGEPYSICENFLTEDTELITAWSVFHSGAMQNNVSDYAHLLWRCDQLGIPDVRASIDKMLTLDYIIANEDRHYTNFGFVREAETLKWVGAAPVYDCGTSLWHNALDVGEPRKCQPFAKTHDEQIRFVSDLSWFKTDALKSIEQDILSVFSGSRTVDENRGAAIAKAVFSRAAAVGRLARGH